MNRKHAERILSSEIEALRGVPYLVLVSKFLHKPETVERAAVDGTLYQVERQALWDDQERRNVRVLVGVDDGGLRVFVPLTDEFIKAPDDSFVGE